MNLKRPGYAKYPVKTCRSLHFCELCRRDITHGNSYHDGGPGKRAHVLCVRKQSVECKEGNIVEAQLNDGRRIIGVVKMVWDSVSGRKVRILSGDTVRNLNANQIKGVLRMRGHKGVLTEL